MSGVRPAWSSAFSRDALTPVHPVLPIDAVTADWAWGGSSGAGIKVARFLTGSYVTALDMAGVSITVSALDGKAKELWDAPVHTAALRWGG